MVGVTHTVVSETKLGHESVDNMESVHHRCTPDYPQACSVLEDAMTLVHCVIYRQLAALTALSEAIAYLRSP